MPQCAGPAASNHGIINPGQPHPSAHRRRDGDGACTDSADGNISFAVYALKSLNHATATATDEAANQEVENLRGFLRFSSWQQSQRAFCPGRPRVLEGALPIAGRVGSAFRQYPPFDAPSLTSAQQHESGPNLEGIARGFQTSVPKKERVHLMHSIADILL